MLSQFTKFQWQAWLVENGHNMQNDCQWLHSYKINMSPCVYCIYDLLKTKNMIPAASERPNPFKSRKRENSCNDASKA